MKTYRLYFSIILLLPFVLGACKETHKNKTVQNAEETKTEIAPYLLSDDSREASCVYLSEDEKMNPVVSWVEVDSKSKEKAFYFARLDADTGQFGKPMSIPIQQNASIHEEGMPKIAVKGDGSLFALYETSEPPKEGERWGLGDVRYIQSFDDGKTWTAPKSVAPNDYKAYKSSSFSGLSRLSNGEIGIAWLSTSADEAYKGRPIKFAKTEGKEGLTTPIVIDKHACECCRIAMDNYGDSGLIMAYRSLRGDNIRDIAIAKSENNGNSFDTPNSFTGDNWQINGCPHNGPSIVASEHQFYVTWFTGKEDVEGVQYAELDSTGAMQNRKQIDVDGQFIQVAALNGERYLAYNHDYPGDNGEVEGKIIVEKVQDGKYFKKAIDSPKAKANYPVLKLADNGNLIVAWSDEGQIRYISLSPDSITEEEDSYFLTDNR